MNEGIFSLFDGYLEKIRQIMHQKKFDNTEYFIKDLWFDVTNC